MTDLSQQMNNLSVNGEGNGSQKSQYVPPHLRNRSGVNNRRQNTGFGGSSGGSGGFSDRGDRGS
ncbi:hypothetical protein OXX69_010334, partial [Metschnikowia pulcherrima]